MITVCELTVFNAGHESFNSATIYGLRLAYPDEDIVFYASKLHISAIRSNFERNNIVINNILYIEANAQSFSTVISLVKSFFLLRSIINNSIKNSSNHIFFLSSGTYLMKLAKIMRKKYYKEMNFTFTLHGEFETIAGCDVVAPGRVAERGLLTKVRENLSLNGVWDTFRMALRVFGNKFVARLDGFLMDRLFYGSRNPFHAKESILYDACDKYKYVAYGKHAKNYAAELIDIDKNLISFMHLPIFMKCDFDCGRNDFIRFAVFGVGDMDAVHKIGKIIGERNLKNRYEIRNIGPCGIVANYIDCSTMCGPSGHFIDREKMDWCAEDIDIFIITNGRDRYRLSSSGSVFEAISHVKPIIHLDNDCSNYFNDPDLPIGIKCRDVEEMAEKMVDIIQSYDAYRGKLEEFRKNILVLQNRIRVENQLEDIRAIFTFSNAK